jgi:hypothetical protein
MKFNKWLLGLAALTAVTIVTAVRAQSITVPNLIGHVVSYQGQNFLISTNGDGSLQVSSFGVQGTNSILVPSNPDQAMAVATAWINANNPANKGYYGTNEIDARLGAAYLQNSGQAVAVLSVDKYGTFGWSNVGFGAGLIQGNNGGKSGTAGGYAEAVYRKPIGDVAAVGGVLGGYDNWNHKGFGGVKGGLEYRQNPHLGEWIDAIYCFEPSANDRGLLIGGGISYAF